MLDLCQPGKIGSDVFRNLDSLFEQREASNDLAFEHESSVRYTPEAARSTEHLRANAESAAKTRRAMQCLLDL